MPTAGLNRRLDEVLSSEKDLVIIPFKAQVNGTSNPDNLECANIASVTRAEAGEFEFTLVQRPAKCIVVLAGISDTADDVDRYCRCDWSTVESAGTFKVFVQTAATQTDPTDNMLIGGIIVCLKSAKGWS